MRRSVEPEEEEEPIDPELERRLRRLAGVMLDAALLLPPPAERERGRDPEPEPERECAPPEARGRARGMGPVLPVPDPRCPDDWKE